AFPLQLGWVHRWPCFITHQEHLIIDACGLAGLLLTFGIPWPTQEGVCHETALLFSDITAVAVHLADRTSSRSGRKNSNGFT
ncbi:MAG: hypothetical protein ACXV7J_09705, partial [Methylomonas sp.]